MSYCIYLRKSRKDLEAEQHGEGETLADTNVHFFLLLRKTTLLLAIFIEKLCPEKL